MIPYGIIEDIKNRCSIEDVISSYVTLKRAGSNLNGLCPFHSERTPSFTVFQGNGSFYCFGCGAGGDVISFIMRVENLGYREAVEFLAKRAGITIPEDDVKREDGVSRSRILEMNKTAARFFREILFDDKLGAKGRDYILRRGLTGPIIKRFGIGYAPKDFSCLTNYMRGKGYTDEELVVGFLCGRSRKTSSLFDMFRDRVMFPIIDVSGNVVAFGGRIIGSDEPKYLNSSDTPAFKKSRQLFALNFAKSSCSENIILCEGYMDVIALHAAGFENAVATLGTAITPEHARIIKKYTKKVTISYDSDSAGIKAADRALRILGDAGVEAKVLRMSGAKDPDEYINKFGADKFKNLIEESRSRFDYMLDNVLSENDIKDPDGKIKASRRVVEYISGVFSGVERDVYCERAAKRLEVDVKSIRQDVAANISKRAKSERKNRPGELIRISRGYSDRVNPDFVKKPRAAKLEECILGLVLIHNEYLHEAVDGRIISEDEFVTEYGKRLFKFISETESEGGFDIGMLSEKFSQDEVSRANRFLIDRRKLSDNSREVFEEVVRSFRKELSATRGDSSSGNIIDIINRKRSDAGMKI